MPFFKWEELEAELITPRYSPAKGPSVEGEKIMMGCFFYPAGGKAEAHAHPNEQIISIFKGKVKFRIENEEKILGAGDVFLIPANAEHEMEIIEDTDVIFCKDLVPNWSIRDAKWEDES
ncbi:MAG: cupin domain-containing protein [SAR324 cluster bacterium]|nr:cupin domain-containing protein [SAR324 cluster bacterium]